MEFEIDSGKIIKIAVLVFVLIIIILLISFFVSKKTEQKNYEVQSVTLERKNVNLTVGDSYYLKSIISPSNAANKNLSYSSNNTFVASVDAYGNVKANNPGEARITVLTSNGKQDQCVINVIEDKIPITSILIEPDDVVLTEGESVNLRVVATPSNTTEHEFTWTSSDESIATVLDGKVTALKSGTTLINVMSESKKIAICDVEVRKKVTGITLNINEKTISVGDKLTLKATLEPIGTNALIRWTSSNPSVATINNGVITAVGVGDTIVTATSEGVSTTAKIKVKIVSTSDIYTFKYVKNQMDKPLMACNTYTASDRAKLEDQLYRAIQKVGYGTRAGVVEAARFLVGALDYRVPYLGPKSKSVDPESVLGYYNKVGLNIGHNRGWGCYVYGWKQGIDCTGFTSWAFKNGGVKLSGVYSNSNTYPSTQVVNQIRPGDLMLSPCYDSCRFDADYSHVGVVIGVDENKIYVAESTTGSINSIVITELDKKNMPTKYKFAVAKLYKYENDGKLTDMWD